MKPIIVDNKGTLVARCNRCFIIICYLKCNDEDCVVIDFNYDHFEDNCCPVNLGDEPPLYCEKCTKLLKYTLNE
jgi:hypothetical protein